MLQAILGDLSLVGSSGPYLNLAFPRKIHYALRLRDANKGVGLSSTGRVADPSQLHEAGNVVLQEAAHIGGSRVLWSYSKSVENEASYPVQRLHFLH